MLNRIIVILVIIAGTVGYSVYQKRSLQDQLVSEPEAILSKLPQSVFEDLEGESFDTYQYFQTESPELLVVHFWGTWCGPCEAELPELLSLIKHYEGRSDVKFILVAVNDEVKKIKKHLKTLDIPKGSIVWLIDNKNIHRDIYGTTRVPETYVFSSDKTTLRKYVGPQEWNKTMFFRTFDEFLQISSHKL
jgi:cytochrome c biogenesis protein CcmG, thiol:disulfide interchange protein DsbE